MSANVPELRVRVRTVNLGRLPWAVEVFDQNDQLIGELPATRVVHEVAAGDVGRVSVTMLAGPAEVTSRELRR